MRVSVQQLAHARGLDLPRHATPGSAGLDLVAANETEIRLEPLGRAAIPCGISLALPEGFEAQVRPRSGLALRHGITVLNAPGTIDSDYRGEVMVILINLGAEPFAVTRGMKIAQLIIAPYERVNLRPVSQLPESRRGDGGFGSTGISD